MLASSIVAPVVLSSAGESIVVSLTPSTDAGSSVVLTAHGTFENLATLQVTWGNGEDSVNYNNESVGDSSTSWEIRGYGTSYGDGTWGLTLVIVFNLNEVVIDTFNNTVGSLPLEFTLNPSFDGSGNVTVLDATVTQVA